MDKDTAIKDKIVCKYSMLIENKIAKIGLGSKVDFSILLIS